MSPERRSSAAIVAGQIASALIGFGLGVVVTLLAVVDWPAPPKPQPQAPAPVAAAPALVPAVPAPAPAPPAAAAPVTPTPVAPAPMIPPPAAPPAEPAPIVVSPSPAPVPAAKPVKPNAKAKPSEPSASRARYAVQAGSFVSEQIAGKVASRLTGHDHPAEVVQRTDDTGKVWNVVRLREIFADRDEAVQTSGALKRTEEVDTLVIRLPPASPDETAKPADKPGAEPPS
jgi:cell division protein FtsN